MAYTPLKFSALTAATDAEASGAIYPCVTAGGANRGSTAAQIRMMAKYTLATLPAPVAGLIGAVIWVSDATGGAVPAYCNGTNWKRFDTNATVS